MGHQNYCTAGGGIAHLNAWHQDQVVERPEGATVLASSDFCENAALAYGDRIYTVQTHPEFTSAVIAGLLAKRADAVPEELKERARQMLDHPTTSADEADRFESLFKSTFANGNRYDRMD